MRPHDGPGDQVREEADEEEIIEVPIRRRDLLAVDVDGVAHRLEGEERDAEGQHEAQVRRLHVEAGGGEELRERVDGEVPVLEEREDAQVVDERDEEQRLAPPRRLGATERAADGEVDGAADEDDPEAQQRPEERAARDLPAPVALSQVP